MRTPAEDAEVTNLLREFDRTAARLIALGITVKHLDARVVDALSDTIASSRFGSPPSEDAGA